MKTSNWLLLGGGVLAAYYILHKSSKGKSDCGCSSSASMTTSPSVINESKVEVPATISSVSPVAQAAAITFTGDANSVVLSPLNSMIIPSDYQKMPSWEKNVNRHMESYACEQRDALMIDRINSQSNFNIKNFQ